MIIKRLTGSQDRFASAIGVVIGVVLIRWLPPTPKWFLAATACILFIAAPFMLVRALARWRRGIAAKGAKQRGERL